MSLLRLLRAGKSLVDNQDSVGRYRLTSQRLLPKFGSKKNPFRAPANESPKKDLNNSTPQLLKVPADESVEETVTPSEGVVTKNVMSEGGTVHGFKVGTLLSATEEQRDVVTGPNGTQRLPVQPAAGFANATEVSNQGGLIRMEGDGVVILRSRENVVSGSPFVAGNPTKISLWEGAAARCGHFVATLRQSPPLLFVLCANWGSAAWAGLVCFTKAVMPKMKEWWEAVRAKGRGLTRRKPQLPKPAIPTFPKPAVQGELSLDRVKVMRNDLSDSDLEVVPAKASVSASGVVATAKSTTSEAGSSERFAGEPEWQRVSLEMFGAGKS